MFERYGLAGTSLWAANYINSVPFNQTVVEEEELDEWLGTTIQIVDVWGCANISITDLSQLTDINPMCTIQAVSSYIMWLCNNATSVIQGYLNDEPSFNASYTAYVNYIQQSIMSDYAVWVDDNEGYFDCTINPSYSADCYETQYTVGKDETCMTETYNGLQLQSG
jgi:hypothetical protein